uniref:Probable RNA polymerase II nuclear localization protein SLC7A6OS n=1 Tax=Leptobrachium leishanense TaxID=445787 RepID=A0A8C5QW27_9ANUR
SDPTVLQVKRKREAEPAEALVISCKRLRLEEQENAVFRLAATVSSQNEPLQKYISDALSRDRAAQVLRPSMGSMERIQQGCEKGDTVTNSHFQLFDMVQEESETPAEEIKEADPEAILCNAVKMIREHLTVSEQSQGSGVRENSSPTDWIQDVLYVQLYTQEQKLVPDDLEPEEMYEDEDDENDEGNWRNAYPDEDNNDQEERYQGYFEENDGPSYCNKNHRFLEEEEDRILRL